MYVLTFGFLMYQTSLPGVCYGHEVTFSCSLLERIMSTLSLEAEFRKSPIYIVEAKEVLISFKWILSHFSHEVHLVPALVMVAY